MKIYKPFNGLHYGRPCGASRWGDEAAGRASISRHRVSLSTRVCLGVVAIKADATATASTTPAWDEWPFVQSLMHPFSRCFLSTCCVPGMVLGAGAKW